MPRELKPEDVMRALDILDKMDFFQGQRAGRELWFEKPFEVQEQDIADFSQGIAFVKNLIADAPAILREKDAEIERLKAEIGRLGEQCRVFAIEYPKITRAEAITEFAERIKAFYRNLGGKTVGGSVEYHVEQVKAELLGGAK
jgi:hypothetical protein